MNRALILINPGWRAVVATNLCSTGGKILCRQITSSMPIYHKQLLAEELSIGLGRSRGLTTSAVRLSDEKKGDDHISLSKKVDPKEAAAMKAAEEATKKALEKKRKQEEKEDKSKPEKEAKDKAEKEAKAKKEAEEKAKKEAAAKKKSRRKGSQKSC